MLWYKSWLETRWRFFIGVALLLCSAWMTVFSYPYVLKLMPLVPDVEGELGRQIRDAVELTRTFGGFVWSEWFRQNHSQLITLFAILLGTAGFLSRSGGASFTLSLPVSRQRLVAVRASAGLAELFVLALVPSLVFPLLAPAVGQTYGVGAAIVHSVCVFVASAVFHNLSLLLSTMFGDAWRPLLIAIVVAIALSVVERLLHVSGVGVFRVMSAESYFRHGELPWAGLLASGAVAAALYYAAVANLARRDF